jgi:hypothetical protein
MGKIPQLKIYAGAPLQAFLNRHPRKPDISVRIGTFGRVDQAETITDSVAINRMAERYMHILSKSLPDLDETTWAAVFQSVNGRTEFDLQDMRWSIFGLLVDEIGAEPFEDEETLVFAQRLEDQTGVSYVQLAQLDSIQNMAIYELAERFWSRSDDGDSLLDWVSKNGFMDSIEGGDHA